MPKLQSYNNNNNNNNCMKNVFKMHNIIPLA